MGVDESRISVVPNGVEERFFDGKPLSCERRAALRIPEDYLLIVGTLEPRKNHLNLFNAIQLLDRRVDLPLVVAGRRGWEDEPIMREASRLVDRGRVILVDFVPDSDLPGLYAGARVVVYPSWYEGFGLPVAEAMASGSPVVTSTAAALKETGGNSAIYCDPAEPECIAEGIERAVREENQSTATKFARQARAREFNWERSGISLAGVFQQLASERSGDR
jgi:alpha-1,3-rhamnosyl/mannosyltransferase